MHVIDKCSTGDTWAVIDSRFVAYSGSAHVAQAPITGFMLSAHLETLARRLGIFSDPFFNLLVSGYAIFI